MNPNHLNTTEKQAYLFIDKCISENINNDNIINELRIIILAQNPVENQIRYINTIAQYVLEKADEHFKTCANPKRCEEAMNWRDLLFFINELQSEFAIGLNNEEIFSEEEKEAIIQKIKIFNETFNKTFNERHSQEEAQYLIDELNELKQFFFLGKKNWNYLLLGKAYSMKNDNLINEDYFNEILLLSSID